jgi:hypothetical protein
MKNEKRVHLEAYYQKELEDVKNNMARMSSLLEQLLQIVKIILARNQS